MTGKNQSSSSNMTGSRQAFCALTAKDTSAQEILCALGTAIIAILGILVRIIVQ